MATTQHLTPPERVFNGWRDDITQFAQTLASLRERANTFEQRIGMEYFNQFKFAGTLTEEEQQFNNDIQWLADQTLEMVSFYNRLNTFMDAANLAVLGRQRTDL